MKTRILMAGSSPGSASGNAVSSEVLVGALQEVGDVTRLEHRMAPLPSWRARDDAAIELGTQPFVIHGEALAAGFVQKRRLSEWTCGWAVNSRYAGALMMSGLPYAIWEATLTADELESSTIGESRMNGRGTGLGFALHSALLPIGEGIEGLLYRKAAVLCAMSEYTRSRMVDRHRLRSDRVLLLPHPPSRAFLDALNRARLRIPGRERPSNEGLRLLCVGRVDDPRKAVADLLAAVARAKSEHMSIELTVAGPYSERWKTRFSALIAASGARLLGRIDIDNLARQYVSHDALVLPSRQEGFGIVVTEAFHAGLPVIATRCGGPEATIRSSGGGILTERAPAAMVSSFQTIANNDDLRRELSARAASYASDELAPAAFNSRVRELTERIVEDASIRKPG